MMKELGAMANSIIHMSAMKRVFFWQQVMHYHIYSKISTAPINGLNRTLKRANGEIVCEDPC